MRVRSRATSSGAWLPSLLVTLIFEYSVSFGWGWTVSVLNLALSARYKTYDLAT